MARQDPKDMIEWYNQAKSQRANKEADWRLASAYCLPRQYNSWNTDGPANINGNTQAAARRIAYDTTGMRALPKFMAVLERICTPHNMRWQTLTASDRNLASNLRVRGYFDRLNDKLFQMRYAPEAKYIQATGEMYGQVGTYGTGPVFLGQRKKSNINRNPGFMYKSCPLRDVFLMIDDDGNVTHVFRRFWLNFRMFKAKFPGAVIPKCFASQDASGKPQEQTYYEFIHVCCEQSDYDPKSFAVNRHPISASYLSVSDQEYIGEEEGYLSMPYLTPRSFTEAGDPYGIAVAAQALPAMGTASQIKKSTLKQGQKAADPSYLVHDDGVLNGPLDIRPGSSNMGGVDKQGRLLVHMLPTGNFQVSDKLLQDERADINDAFFVTLFQMFMDGPEKKEAEIMEMIAEKSMIVAPIMGRMQSEYTNPGTMREIDMLHEMGMMEPMPPELIEAKGDYQIISTSPMAKGMYAEEVAGFMRSVNFAIQLVEATQDPSHLDAFNFDVAIPEMSEFQATPTRWLNDAKTKAAKGRQRSQQNQQQTLIQNAGNISAAAKNVAQIQAGPQGQALPAPAQAGVPPPQPSIMPGLPQMGG